MTVTVPRLTSSDLATFPDDGMRYEIIEGELFVAAAPLKAHQRLLRRLTRLFDDAVTAANVGEVFFAPVDVRFSELDQVQPDLIVIRNERAGVYRGNTVFGAPDVVLEVISPSNRSYDEVRKLRLYERNGVPEYWLGDSIERRVRLFVLRDGRYVEVEPENGTLRSTVIPNMIVDIAELMDGIDD